MQPNVFGSPTRFNIPVPELDDSPQKPPMKSPRKIGINVTPRKSFLPTLPLNGSLPRISGETLVNLLNGDYDEFFDYLYIVDCRYKYEYNGGHIHNAMNCNDLDLLDGIFFNKPIPNTVLIFHCEFSQNRGPQMASLFREKDRELNKMEYPNLYYPNVFILDGGYRKFFEEYPDYCDGGYTKMLDDEHRTNGDLIRATNDFRKNVDKAMVQRRNMLKTLPVHSNFELLKSPTSVGDLEQSPVSSKMLSFYTSPIILKNHRVE